MKITKSKIIRVELEPEDNSGHLYDFFGNLTGNDSVSIVDGAIEVREPRA